jgi:DNA-binding NarL/FixJ family response regulator
MIRIVVADDHPIFRQGLKAVIEREPDMQLAAEAPDGRTAVEDIGRLMPDIAILDVQMPGLSGFEVAQQVRANGWRTQLVFLTMFANPAVFDQAMSASVRGYVLKDAALLEIVQAVRAVVAGGTFVSPALTGHLVRRAYTPAQGARAASGLASLTERERHILRLVADAYTSKEIAETLGIHYRTIENHRTAMSQKLGLQGSHALVKFAFEHKTEI